MQSFGLSLLLITLSFTFQYVESQTWTNIGTGVNYWRANANNNGIFIGYAGFSVQQSWSNKWAFELYKAALQSLGVGHVYSVMGPRNPSYSDREIGNTALVKHLLPLASSTQRIIIAAHSSGSFVAHELLSHLYEKGMDKGQTSNKIIYFNLDGGSSGLTSTIVNKLQFVYTVYAKKGPTLSANAATMQYIDSIYTKASSIIIDANSSPCTSGSKWCLHDVMINRSPYNPNTYDLYRDYFLISSTNPVQTAYLSKISGREICNPPGASGVCGPRSSCTGKVYTGYCSGSADNVCCVSSSSVVEEPELIPTLTPENLTNSEASVPEEPNIPTNFISPASIVFLKKWQNEFGFGATLEITSLKETITSFMITLDFFQGEVLESYWGTVKRVNKHGSTFSFYSDSLKNSLEVGESASISMNFKFSQNVAIDEFSGIPALSRSEINGVNYDFLPLVSESTSIEPKPFGEFKGGLSPGSIGGIVAACFVLVVVSVIIIVVILKKKKNKNAYV